MIFAGVPPTIQLEGTFFVTTELGAIVTLSPILTSPIIIEPEQRYTWFPILGPLPLTVFSLLTYLHQF